MLGRTLKIAAVVVVLGGLLLALLASLTPLELPELEVPSRVYARPHRVLARQPIETTGLVPRLLRLGYREIAQGDPRPGEFRRGQRSLVLNRRPFHGPLASATAGRVELRLSASGRITQIRGASGKRLPSLILEPEIVGVLHGRERVDRYLVPESELPRHLVDAVLAVEDRRFFSHGGVDPRRMVGAFFANLRARRIVQGGSTLTQQLVKNVFLDDERTLARKLREAWLALRVERSHSKQEILDAYLNTIYMGQRGSVSVRGMGAAARHYFGKQVGELSVSESALLAGLIRGPGLYSPFSNPEAALERRNHVLEMMREEGHISVEELEEATAEPLGHLADAESAVSAPYFTAYVVRQLEARFPDLDLERAKLSVYTGLDAQLQHLAQKAIQDGLAQLEKDYPKLRDEEAPLQGALVALDPDTGEILAHVGGRDFGASQFDRVTQAMRQPGSVFKPVVALAAVARAREGEPEFTLASMLEDEPLSVETPEGPWEPTNHDDEFRGPITLRHALEQSINVPFARLGMELGPRRIIRTARRMGVRSRLRGVPSLALGAFESTPLEIAGMYSVLASSGVRTLPRAILRVRDIDGRDLEVPGAERQRSFSREEIALVNSALRGVVDRGTGAPLRAYGFQGVVAGKTGTTNEGRDGWFVGYTPELVTVVWVGFDDNRSLGLSGSRAALPLFARFAVDALGRRGGTPFPEPRGLQKVDIHPETGLRASFGCPGEPELFLPGTAPYETCAPDWFGIFGSRDRDRDRDAEREREGEAGRRPRVDPDDDRRGPRRKPPGWIRALESVFGALEDAARGRER